MERAGGRLGMRSGLWEGRRGDRERRDPEGGSVSSSILGKHQMVVGTPGRSAPISPASR